MDKAEKEKQIKRLVLRCMRYHILFGYYIGDGNRTPIDIIRGSIHMRLLMLKLQNLRAIKTNG